MSRKRRVMAAMREWFERAEAERRKRPKTIHLHIGMTIDSGERKIMPAVRRWADERKVWDGRD
jgi:hypothetical protein